MSTVMPQREDSDTFTLRLPGWVDQPFKSVTLQSKGVVRSYLWTQVEKARCSSSVSDFILGLQCCSCAIKSCYIRFPKPNCLPSNGVSMTTSVCGAVDSSAPFHVSFVALSSFLNIPGSSLSSYTVLDFDPSLSEFSLHINELARFSLV